MLLNDYNRNGFFIFNNLLDVSQINIVNSQVKDVFSQKLKQLSLYEDYLTLHDSMKLLFNQDLDAYKSVVASLWRLVAVQDLLHDSSIINVLKNNFGFDNIFLPGGDVVHIMSSSLKIPDGYFGLNVHQDFPSIQGSLDGLVVWIPLVDVDRYMFPMEVIPGSHKYGIFPSDELESGWEVKPEYYNESDFVPVECEVGDVVFMSSFTIHRSSKTGDDRLRLACSTRFDNGVEKTFIERSYPTAYKRSVVRKQMFDIANFRKE